MLISLFMFLIFSQRWDVDESYQSHHGRQGQFSEEEIEYSETGLHEDSLDILCALRLKFSLLCVPWSLFK